MRVIDLLSGWQLFFYLFLVVGCALPANVFVVLYGTLVRWQSNPMGQFMFYMGVVVALALDLIVARLFFQAPPWISFVVYVMIFIMTWWCLILFLITYYRGKRSQEDQEVKEMEDRNGH